MKTVDYLKKVDAIRKAAQPKKPQVIVRRRLSDMVGAKPLTNAEIKAKVLRTHQANKLRKNKSNGVGVGY